MYSDPSLIRKNFIKVSLSDREFALVDAYTAYTGEQKATLAREMLLQRAEQLLHMANSSLALVEMRDAGKALLSA